MVERLGAGNAADMVFFDHCKECYLPDLKRFEEGGAHPAGDGGGGGQRRVPRGARFPGLRGHRARSVRHELLDAPFEYDQVWKKDWVPQKDALSFHAR